MAIGRPRRRRLALLICNGHYTRVPEFQLAGPAEDARRLAAVLSNPESCRFDVRVLVDRGLLEVRREIARICRDADAEDTLLIYYSGNGLRDEFGNLYLAVVDVDHDFIDATALDTEFITLQKTFADSGKSWSVDAGNIDATTFDLAVKNPNAVETVTHRSPQDIMEEIAALDAESAEVLASIRDLL